MYRGPRGACSRVYSNAGREVPSALASTSDSSQTVPRPLSRFDAHPQAMLGLFEPQGPDDLTEVVTGESRKYIQVIICLFSLIRFFFTNIRAWSGCISCEWTRYFASCRRNLTNTRNPKRTPGYYTHQAMNRKLIPTAKI